jgi:hypothetical protein
MLVAQQPTKALSTHHEATLMLHTGICDDELVPNTLVIALVVVMGQVRLDHRAEGGLPDHDHPLQSLCFDRADKPFAVGIKIRAPWREDDGLHPASAKYLVEAMKKFRIAIVDQIPLAQEEATLGIAQLLRAWCHEGPVALKL